MDSALDPLDLVKHTARIEKSKASAIDTEGLALYLEEMAQQAANLINADSKEEFLYKNPSKRLIGHKDELPNKTKERRQFWGNSSSSTTFVTASLSTSSDDFEEKSEKVWLSIDNFEFDTIVQQINEFIQTWELSEATKFVIIDLKKTENKMPFGKRHFVEAHFSKPTPKCPNPLAVAKVFFRISVSHLLPKDYPVNVTYKFEGYESEFHAMGEHKLSSNKFQRYYIDSILHMKLAFYAELCECRNPLKPLVKRKQSGKLVTLRSE